LTKPAVIPILYGNAAGVSAADAAPIRPSSERHLSDPQEIPAMSNPTAAGMTPRPPDCNAALVLADGTVFWGRGVGATGSAVGEVCFNTSITGYQEILTDPSYAGQIIAFTFPHIGNVGANREDIETTTPAARGLVIRAPISEAANYRAVQSLDIWLKSYGIVGLSGVDTRRLTRLIRDKGPPNGVIAYAPDGHPDIATAREQARAWPGLEGMDLAKEVTCRQTYEWTETVWQRETGYGTQGAPRFHVVAVDYGAKRNILRMLAEHGCRVTVVPATASTADIMRHRPDGIFLSNGPGDPAATGEYAVPVLRELIDSGKPVFGICLGHQMLALALGGRTRKMDKGHRGANHPVRDEVTGKVEITSQNHGFVVDLDSLPEGVQATHLSLFDRTNEGLEVEGKPVFSVQHHPEASPGPRDSHYLFERFIGLMAAAHSGTGAERE
jgi:carbamoyl-phosphate synthase small subunit